MLRAAAATQKRSLTVSCSTVCNTVLLAWQQSCRSAVLPDCAATKQNRCVHPIFTLKERTISAIFPATRDLVFPGEETVWTKGGRMRTIEILPKYNDVVHRILSFCAPNEKICPKIPDRIDVHGIRSMYACELYLEFARPIDMINAQWSMANPVLLATVTSRDMFGIAMHCCVFFRLWAITARRLLCVITCGVCGRRNLRFHDFLLFCFLRSLQFFPSTCYFK